MNVNTISIYDAISEDLIMDNLVEASLDGKSLPASFTMLNECLDKFYSNFITICKFRKLGEKSIHPLFKRYMTACNVSIEQLKNPQTPIQIQSRINFINLYKNLYRIGKICFTLKNSLDIAVKSLYLDYAKKFQDPDLDSESYLYDFEFFYDFLRDNLESYVTSLNYIILISNAIKHVEDNQSELSLSYLDFIFYSGEDRVVSSNIKVAVSHLNSTKKTVLEDLALNIGSCTGAVLEDNSLYSLQKHVNSV